ncbi:MAG: hypothetical protein ACJ8FP_08930 [Xanthobacteraceae bacterium]
MFALLRPNAPAEEATIPALLAGPVTGFLALHHAADAGIRREPAAPRSVCVALAAIWASLMDYLDSRTHPIQEDMQFQRRTWLAERIGWIVMAALLVAGLAGIFFHGPLSRTIAKNADESVAIDYERFAHKTALTHFVIRTSAPLPDHVLVRLGPSFANMHDIDSIEPRPVRSSGGSYGLEFLFARSSAGDLGVYVAARPKRFGLMSLHVEVEGRGALNIAQLVYP